jgi:hypothetical protein
MDLEHNVYRGDLHGHSNVASDGIDSPERIVAASAKRGIQILGWSDHDSVRHYGVCGWSEFYRALEDHNRRDSSLPILGIPGLEQTTVSDNGSDAHVLAYLPDKVGRRTFLKDSKNYCPTVSTVAFITQMVHEYNAICIIPHPNFMYISSLAFCQVESLAEQLPDDVRPNVGIETMNWMTRLFFATYYTNVLKAQEIASVYKLAAVCCTDYHLASSVGNHFTNFYMSALTTEAFLSAFQQRKVSTPSDQIKESPIDCFIQFGKALISGALIHSLNTVHGK